MLQILAGMWAASRVVPGGEAFPRPGRSLTRPGKHTKTMERSTIFHGKIHYFYGDFP